MKEKHADFHQDVTDQPAQEDGQSDRRQFLKQAAAGSLAALAGACESPAGEQAAVSEEPPAFFKETSRFVPHGATNLEARIEDLGGFITANDRFFVRNNSYSIQVDAQGYTLEIGGDAVSTPLTLSYEDLLNMPSRMVYAYLECGGNQRSFFGTTMGQPAQGTQWQRGGVSMAIWTGIPLRELLQRAGITDTAVDVQLIGLDTDSPEGGFRRPLPVAKAMDPDTILAYRMNGEVLPPDHGHPVRAVVPGWVGSSSVKWLGRIEVSAQKVWSRNNTTSYVLIGDAYPPEGEAGGQVATLQSIKSILILPWPAQLNAGAQMIRGYAYSPHAPISRVEWQDGASAAWQEARFIDPPIQYAWRRFEFEWAPSPGSYTLITRATDEAGHTQPASLPFNEKGYLYNATLAHPVTVA